MIRLGILGSTRGTNMLSLIDAIKDGRLASSIEVVISNKPHAVILERAIAHGLTAEFLNHEGLTVQEYGKQVNQLLMQYRVDVLILIGYMRILSADFVSLWHHKIINLHPSLLPAFSGMMDLQVHQAVLDSGIQETGCTIHYVTEEVDAGPIILQKKCPVLVDDTAQSLKKRVQELEGLALIDVIQLLALS